MPVSWGSPSPAQNRVSGTDIEQFTKWFDMHGLDYEMCRYSGTWIVSAWSRENDIEFVIATSARSNALIDALIACYVETKSRLSL